MLVTRVAARALTLTELSSEAARFQARSAFTGVGFTTSEAEGIVSHPVRVLGAPGPEQWIRPGDDLILYGAQAELGRACSTCAEKAAGS